MLKRNGNCSGGGGPSLKRVQHYMRTMYFGPLGYGYMCRLRRGNNGALKEHLCLLKIILGIAEIVQI